MTDINCSTTAQVQTALQTTAVAGDRIVLAGGAYTGTLSSTGSKNWSANHVLMVAADPNNPPLIRGTWDISNKNGLEIEGLVWEQSGTDGYTGNPPHTGWPVDEGLRIRACSNIVIRHCTWRGTAGTSVSHPGWMECLNFGGPNEVCTGVEIAYCQFQHSGMDNMRLYGNLVDFHIHHCIIGEQRIDPSRQSQSVRHPDAMQGASPPAWTGTPYWDTVLIEDNVILSSDLAVAMQGIFCHNEHQPTMPQVLAGTKAWVDVTVRRNYVEVCHQHGIEFCGNKDLTCTGNKIVHKTLPGGHSKSSITILGNNSGTISNNVIVSTGVPSNGIVNNIFPAGSLDNLTISGNVVTTNSATNPTGWNTNLFNEVGPYAEGSDPGDPPTDTPTTMDVADWSVVVVADPVFTDRYTAEIRIPPTSVAFGFVGFRWSNGVVDVSAGNGTTDVVLTLTDLADGTRRRQLTTTGGGNGHTIAADGIFEDLRVYWREVSGGPLSSASDAKSFSGPSYVPPQPPGRPATLVAADWTIEVVSDPVVTDEFTAEVRIPPTSAAFGFVGLRWSTAVEDTTSGNAGTLTLTDLEPLLDGTRRAILTGGSHTVAAEGTFPSLYLYWRAEVGGQLSAASDQKSFEAPADPTGPSITDVIPAANDWGITETYAISDFVNRFGPVFTFEADGANLFDDDDFTGVQWTDETGVWRDTLASGTDGDGRRRFLGLPASQGGVDHSVQYDEDKTGIRVRVITTGGTSQPSADTKMLEGPAAPAPADPPDPGDFAQVGSDLIVINGLLMRIASNNRPANIIGDISATLLNGRMTITPPPLSADAVSYIMTYANRVYSGVQFRVLVDEDFDQGMIWSVDAAGVGSEARWFTVPES